MLSRIIFDKISDIRIVFAATSNMATFVQENSPLFYDIFIDMTVDFVVLNFICDGKNKKIIYNIVLIGEDDATKQWSFNKETNADYFHK